MVLPSCGNRQARYSFPWYILVLILAFMPMALCAQIKDLNYYMNVALENSPLLKDYQNQMVMNRLDSLILRAVYKPQVNFSSANIYAPKVGRWGYDPGIIDNGTFNALLSVRQSIIGKGNKKTQLQSYNLDNRVLQNTAKISKQDLNLAVASQYIAAYSDLQGIKYNEEIRILLNKEEVALKRLMEKAVYKQVDYLNFFMKLKQHLLLIDQQKASYENNIALLNYVCGIVDTTAVELKAPDITLLPVPEFENTLQYEQFRLDSLKLKNGDALIDYAYHPKLDAFVDAGFNSTLTYQGYKNFGASIGLSLIVPLYDGGQRQKQHNKLKTTQLTRKNYLDFSHKQYRQQLAQFYQQLEQTDRIIKQAQEVMQYTQTLIEANGKLLQNGEVSVTDYILAVNSFLDASHAVIQSTTNRMQIINQINYWNYEK